MLTLQSLLSEPKSPKTGENDLDLRVNLMARKCELCIRGWVSEAVFCGES